MVTRGYSKKIRVLLCRNRTYELPITISDAVPLSYRRLVSGDSGILGKKSECSFAGIKPTSSRLPLSSDARIFSEYPRVNIEKVKFQLSRGGAVVRALTSHQCGPGSIPGPCVICWLSFVLSSLLAPRGFLPGTPVFPSPEKQITLHYIHITLHFFISSTGVSNFHLS